MDKKVLVLGIKKSFYLKNVKNKDKFTFLDYVNDKVYNNYIKNAFAFIYPSLNEGFGYPPLSAMKNGIPIIASAVSAIPEICGEVPIYFNPFSLEELKNRILNLYYEPKLYKKLQEKGIKRIKELNIRQEKDMQSLFKVLFN